MGGVSSCFILLRSITKRSLLDHMDFNGDVVRIRVPHHYARDSLVRAIRHRQLDNPRTQIENHGRRADGLTYGSGNRDIADFRQRPCRLRNLVRYRSRMSGRRFGHTLPQLGRTLVVPISRGRKIGTPPEGGRVGGPVIVSPGPCRVERVARRTSQPDPPARSLNPRLLLLFREVEVAGVYVDLFHDQAGHLANALHDVLAHGLAYLRDAHAVPPGNVQTDGRLPLTHLNIHASRTLVRPSQPPGEACEGSGRAKWHQIVHPRDLARCDSGNLGDDTFRNDGLAVSGIEMDSFGLHGTRHGSGCRGTLCLRVSSSCIPGTSSWILAIGGWFDVCVRHGSLHFRLSNSALMPGTALKFARALEYSTVASFVAPPPVRCGCSDCHEYYSRLSRRHPRPQGASGSSVWHRARGLGGPTSMGRQRARNHTSVGWPGGLGAKEQRHDEFAGTTPVPLDSIPTVVNCCWATRCGPSISSSLAADRRLRRFWPVARRAARRCAVRGRLGPPRPPRPPAFSAHPEARRPAHPVGCAGGGNPRRSGH